MAEELHTYPLVPNCPMIGVVKGVFKKRDDGLCTADDVAKNWPTWLANCIKIRHVILTVFDVIPTGFHVILVPYDDVIKCL